MDVYTNCLDEQNTVLVPLCLPSYKVSGLFKSPLNITEWNSEILASRFPLYTDIQQMELQ